MFPRSRATFRLRGLFVLLLGGLAPISAAPGAGPLRLSATLNHVSLEKITVAKGRIMATAGAATGVAPPQADWRLEGDLAAHASLLALSPAYETERVPSAGPRAAAMGGFSHVAKISFDYSPGPDMPWKQRDLDRAIVVFAWIVDQKPVRVAAIAVTHLLEPPDRIARVNFLMDEADAMRGFAVTLLWKDGNFFAPIPCFRDPEANRWLLAAHFPGSAASLPAPSARIASVRGRQGVSLLHLAAESGLEGAVEALLSAGAKPNVTMQTSSAPLHWAARLGRTGVIRKLAAAGAKVNLDHGDGNYPLRQALRRRHDDASAALVEAGAHVDRRVNGLSSAELALELGLVKTLRTIAAHGGLKPLRRAMDARLHAALKSGQTEFVSLLLAQGANPNHRLADEPALVAIAAHASAPELIDALLRAGADSNGANRDGLTPLAAAARAGFRSNVQRLLAAGADPNRADGAGRTALHHAVSSFDPLVPPILLQAGARADALDKKGVSALEIALARQARAVVAALLAAGARIDLKTKSAPEQLATAVLLDLREPLQRAAADGWDRARIAGVRWTPLTLARFAGATEVAAWLEKDPALQAAPGIAVVGAGDTPPEPDGVKPPVDPRTEDAALPGIQVMVGGIVDADGTFLHSIAATTDERLRIATLDAVRTWRFKPARIAGAATAVAIKFPVSFAARDNQVYSLSDVDVPPDVRRASNFIQQMAQQLATSGLRYVGASMVGFVVEKDGSVREITLPENLPPDYVETLRRMVTDTRFSPATRHGRPVRTWVEMLAGYDLKVTYVFDESARFNLPR